MTRADLLTAKQKGHTHAVTIDKSDGGRKLVSTHRSHDEARKAIRSGKDNTVYLIEDLLR